jgi:phospholipase/lecithinase/hemolysin
MDSNLGARNFLFLNVPPADRAPLVTASHPRRRNAPTDMRLSQFLGQSSAVQAAEKSQILDFNTKLAAAVTAFRGNHTGVRTFLWDSHTFFTTVLNSPTTYGFKDATSYGTGSQYFWGYVSPGTCQHFTDGTSSNNYHPSGAAHLLFGKQISALLNGTAWA